MEILRAPGWSYPPGEVDVRFYLEFENEDVQSSIPVISCVGEKAIEVPDHDDIILIARHERSAPFTLTWHPEGKTVETTHIAITAGSGTGNSIRNMVRVPWPVIAYLPGEHDPKSIRDFQFISRAHVWHGIPSACRQLLGYPNY